MAIATSCPHCGQQYSLADSQLGKTVRCRGCNEPFDVGAPAVVLVPVGGDRPRRRGRGDPDCRRDEEYDERPRRRRARGGIPVWAWVAGGVGGFVLLLGLGVGILFATGALAPSKVTPENFTKLKPGMTEAEVVAILGKPTEVVDDPLKKAEKILGDLGAPPGFKVRGMKILQWRDGDNSITVSFFDGLARQFDGRFGAKKW